MDVGFCDDAPLSFALPTDVGNKILETLYKLSDDEVDDDGDGDVKNVLCRLVSIFGSEFGAELSLYRNERIKGLIEKIGTKIDTSGVWNNKGFEGAPLGMDTVYSYLNEILNLTTRSLITDRIGEPSDTPLKDGFTIWSKLLYYEQHEGKQNLEPYSTIKSYLTFLKEQILGTASLITAGVSTYDWLEKNGEAYLWETWSDDLQNKYISQTSVSDSLIAAIREDIGTIENTLDEVIGGTYSSDQPETTWDTDILDALDNIYSKLAKSVMVSVRDALPFDGNEVSGNGNPNDNYDYDYSGMVNRAFSPAVYSSEKSEKPAFACCKRDALCYRDYSDDEIFCNDAAAGSNFSFYNQLVEVRSLLYTKLKQDFITQSAAKLPNLSGIVRTAKYLFSLIKNKWDNANDAQKELEWELGGQGELGEHEDPEEQWQQQYEALYAQHETWKQILRGNFTQPGLTLMNCLHDIRKCLLSPIFSVHGNGNISWADAEALFEKNPCFWALGTSDAYLCQSFCIKKLQKNISKIAEQMNNLETSKNSETPETPENTLKSFLRDYLKVSSENTASANFEADLITKYDYGKLISLLLFPDPTPEVRERQEKTAMFSAPLLAALDSLSHYFYNANIGEYEDEEDAASQIEKAYWFKLNGDEANLFNFIKKTISDCACYMEETIVIDEISDTLFKKILGELQSSLDPTQPQITTETITTAMQNIYSYFLTMITQEIEEVVTNEINGSSIPEKNTLLSELDSLNELLLENNTAPHIPINVAKIMEKCRNLLTYITEYNEAVTVDEDIKRQLLLGYPLDHPADITIHGALNGIKYELGAQLLINYVGAYSDPGYGQCETLYAKLRQIEITPTDGEPTTESPELAARAKCRTSLGQLVGALRYKYADLLYDGDKFNAVLQDIDGAPTGVETTEGAPTGSTYSIRDLMSPYDSETPVSLGDVNERLSDLIYTTILESTHSL
jgi:hypothetical protein